MQLFETTRLIIRKFTPDDGEELREYAVYKQQTGFEAFNEWPTDLEGCQGLASYFAGCLPKNGQEVYRFSGMEWN